MNGEMPVSVRDELGAMSREDRLQFGKRAERWWPDLEDGLARIYEPEVVASLGERLLRLAARTFAHRPAELAALDVRRIEHPDWFQSPAMVGYAAYADRFAGTLAGCAGHIDYLRELGVRYLHLMPIFLSRDSDSDGGYAVADFRAVRPDLGSIDDLARFATALRHAGISLVLDLVLNHVAREHPWARAARAGDPYYRAFFLTFADRTLPDAYERTLPEVFPDFAPGSFTWDAELDGWVWTTFNTFQWDLNWANPEVLYAFAEIVLFLANLGVEVLRLDAIAFLWKRMSTNCQNQPEVHAITKALRSLARIAAPAVVFKAEAIVAPADLMQYLGTGADRGKVCDLAYHNSLMVQIWSTLASRDVRLAAHALSRMPAKPSGTAWITYLRCHDDIGWAIDDGDAAAVGLDAFAHRAFLSDYYSGVFPGSFARGHVFQANPHTGDRRISGMTAGLGGVQAAAGDPQALTMAIRRILLAYAIVLGWGGIPVIWMGDEIGLADDPDWFREPGHDSDNRWTHRPRMDWTLAGRRVDGATLPGRLFGGLRHLIEVRAGLVQMHAAMESEILPIHDPGVLPVLRRHPAGPLLALYNCADSERRHPVADLCERGLQDGIDAITGTSVRERCRGEGGEFALAPYDVLWITPARQTRAG